MAAMRRMAGNDPARRQPGQHHAGGSQCCWPVGFATFKSGDPLIRNICLAAPFPLARWPVLRPHLALPISSIGLVRIYQVGTL
jgi:hypothetical protein